MTSSIEPGVTLIENNAETQTWATPGDIDLANFVFGDSYVTLEVQQISSNDLLEVNRQSLPLRRSFATPIGSVQESVDISARVDGIELRNQLKLFRALHTVIGTRGLLYLIVLNRGGYHEFIDPNNVAQEFAPGWIAAFNLSLSGNDVDDFNLKISFDIVWG